MGRIEDAENPEGHHKRVQQNNEVAETSFLDPGFGIWPHVDAVEAIHDGTC